jgi:hypothetical protein
MDEIYNGIITTGRIYNRITSETKKPAQAGFGGDGRT